MSRKRVLCRECGVRGLEDPDDPAPGLCASCLDRAMAKAMWGMLEDRWRSGFTIRACLRRMLGRLEAIGLSKAAVRSYRRGAERMLADELALERMAN